MARLQWIEESQTGLWTVIDAIIFAAIFARLSMVGFALACCKMPSAPRLDLRYCELRYSLQDAPAWVSAMTMSDHWKRDTKPSPVIIEDGEEVWNEFLREIKLQDYHMTCLFDKHGVIDSVNNWDEAADIGVSLDHEDDVCSLMCSFGRKPNG